MLKTLAEQGPGWRTPAVYARFTVSSALSYSALVMRAWTAQKEHGNLNGVAVAIGAAVTYLINVIDPATRGLNIQEASQDLTSPADRGFL